jgi:hypothetical protein
MIEWFNRLHDRIDRVLCLLEKILILLERHGHPPRPPARVRATWSSIMSTATITWVDPVNRTDGSAIAPDTFSVSIFDSASPTPTQPIGTVAEGVQTFTTGSLSAGLHTYTLVATDSEGDVSVPSVSASVTVPVTIAAPNPPTAVTATLSA